MSEVKSTFDAIQSRFDSGVDLGDFTAVYHFKLGEPGGDWTLRIEGGKGKVESSGAEDATCTITVSAEDFISMVSKESNPQMLFMTGKLKVAGNMGQALKLQKVLG